jgi:preprotein translocase subunit YajC
MPFATAAPPQSMSMFNFLFMMLIVFGIFWFLIIGPTRRRQKKLQELIGNLKRGDQVVTNGGIYGRVVRADDHTVTLAVASNVEIKFAKSAVVGLAKDGAEATQ